ncbi:hypothetical protein F2Q70_00024797 [Brassica cretica]|uniref:O-acyltransferase WSD1 C-terminal domain-containing protein n=1 Tax=Brassica cretica TaxID=69181 RepID=A0A8S9LEH5_BRACR|nr:hypothetical protein F2Q70_00024797 [Brassica cretica]KAF3582116.1 hypothetical protein DY000_02028998 [Brassica cretica]
MLRIYLKDNENPMAGNKKQILDKTRLRGTVAVNLRPATKIEALIIHYVSYVDKLIINLAVDTAVIPDPHLLCDDLVESLNIIKLAALEKGLHKMEV